MLISDKEFLVFFGWDDFYQNQIPDLVSSSLVPARIICEERNLYRVQTGFDQIFWASVSGKLQFNAVSRADYPAVGDWVLVDVQPEYDRGIIHQVLNRKTILHRKQVGASDMQILSTNVDYAFITSSVNADLNFRRFERYLAVAQDAGVIPIILLTKADLCSEDLNKVIAEVQSEFPFVDVHAISNQDYERADFLKKYLREGTTSIFMGSSGVGKSTLVNFLIGESKIKTQEIREDDDKGKHTTTSRNLYVSRYGGLIIDTPGMRELQLSDHLEGVQTQFSDIENLISRCRFSDCKHDTEPNCAIQAALATEELSGDRWKSYQKLEAEVRHSLRKQDKVLAAEDKKMWKKRSIEARHRGHAKRGRDS